MKTFNAIISVVGPLLLAVNVVLFVVTDDVLYGVYALLIQGWMREARS